MDKRERLEKTLAGEPTDRVPAALWRHFPGDDQRAADLARSTIEFQKSYDWDFVKVTPASSFSVVDFGVQDQWEGSAEGIRTSTRHVVNRSLEWTDLRSLDPTRGALGRQLECLSLIESGLGDPSIPIIQTILSPLAQAKLISGDDVLLRHLRTYPDRVHTGLNVITESTLRFIEALKRSTSIAGIYYDVQHANYDVMSEDEYKTFGLPYDRKVLDAIPGKWWLNLLHFHGNAPMFKLVDNFRVQAVNWNDRECEPDLAKGKSLFVGAVCGGLSSQEHVHYGTPATIRDVAREALSQTNRRRFILSTGCVTMITSPLSNIRAVREVVESA